MATVQEQLEAMIERFFIDSTYTAPELMGMRINNFYAEYKELKEQDDAL